MDWTGRFATSHATIPPEISNPAESAALQQTRGNGRGIATPAIDRQGAFLRQGFPIFVSQARKAELLENHCAPSSPANCYFGWGTIRR